MVNQLFQICSSTFEYYRAHGHIVNEVSKGCVSREVCDIADEENRQYCKAGLPHINCTYCCEGPYCNYKQPFGMFRKFKKHMNYGQGEVMVVISIHHSNHHRNLLLATFFQFIKNYDNSK